MCFSLCSFVAQLLLAAPRTCPASFTPPWFPVIVRGNQEPIPNAISLIFVKRAEFHVDVIFVPLRRTTARFRYGVDCIFSESPCTLSMKFGSLVFLRHSKSNNAPAL